METLGEWGEALAARHLARAGYEILARNWRTGRLELDLIARDGDTIAFVEVKTRRAGGLHPADAVDRTKRRRLRRAAARWIASQPIRAAGYRFDVVSIVQRPAARPLLRHDVDAFTGDDA